jgi:hypothetical protein
LDRRWFSQTQRQLSQRAHHASHVLPQALEEGVSLPAVLDFGEQLRRGAQSGRVDSCRSAVWQLLSFAADVGGSPRLAGYDPLSNIAPAWGSVAVSEAIQLDVATTAYLVAKSLLVDERVSARPCGPFHQDPLIMRARRSLDPLAGTPEVDV